MIIRFFLTCILCFFTPLLCAQLTKGQVDFEVTQFNDSISQVMGREGAQCRSEATSFIDEINKAHQPFMNDFPLQAAIKAINVIEYSGRRSLAVKQCPFSIVTKAPTTKLYLTYFVEHSSTDISINKINGGNQPSESDRRYMSSRFLDAYQKMSEYCKRYTCRTPELRIITFSKALYEDINQPVIKTDYIIARTFAIRSFIASSYDTQGKILFNMNNDMLNILSLMKGYVYNRPDLDLHDQYELKLINAVLQERDLISSCPIILLNYFSALDGYPLNGTKQHDLLQLVHLNNRLFEELNEYHYSNTYKRNAHCTLTDEFIFNLPYSFSSDVKKLIYAMMPSGH